MQISLRKAMALQTAINELVSTIRILPSVQISIFVADRTAAIAAARKDLETAMERRGALLDALYLIRDLVASANEASGVNRLLARVARLEKDIQMISGIAAVPAREPYEILQARVQRLLKRDETAGHDHVFSRTVTTDNIEISLFDEYEVEANQKSLRELKLEKQRLQDELSEMNVRTTISLPETVATLLQGLSLI